MSAPPSSSAVTSSPVAALTSGGPARKTQPRAADHDRLVAQRRQVGAAGRAVAEHDRQLRDPGAAQQALLLEDVARPARRSRPAGGGRRRRSRACGSPAAGSPARSPARGRSSSLMSGYQAPPFSELSSAMTITSRPLTTPTPGDQQRLRRLAVVGGGGRQRHSSRNGEPGSSSSSSAPRTVSLSCSASRSSARAGARGGPCAAARAAPRRARGCARGCAGSVGELGVDGSRDDPLHRPPHRSQRCERDQGGAAVERVADRDGAPARRRRRARRRSRSASSCSRSRPAARPP